jgi:hypothetical protein
MDYENIEKALFQTGTIAVLVAFILAAFRFGFEYLNIKSKN